MMTSALVATDEFLVAKATQCVSNVIQEIFLPVLLIDVMMPYGGSLTLKTLLCVLNQRKIN